MEVGLYVAEQPANRRLENGFQTSAGKDRSRYVLVEPMMMAGHHVSRQLKGGARVRHCDLIGQLHAHR